MELTIERAENERDCIYMQNVQECKPLVIRESGGMDYSSAVVLLRNLGERKDTTPLEREALSSAIRLLKHNIGAKKQ